jgi:hypothetical protein
MRNDFQPDRLKREPPTRPPPAAQDQESSRHGRPPSLTKFHQQATADALGESNIME